MTLTVLSDNRTADNRLQTEHGLSILIETSRHKVLLDTGASDQFLRNAKIMGIDLTDVNYVFLSHGHADHTGGLSAFLKMNQRAQIIVSPHAVHRRFYSNRGHLHSITPEWPKSEMEGRTIFIDHTQEVIDGLHVITHIPHKHPMPEGNRNLYVEAAKDDYMPDDFRHELALYTDGLLFTGCAHSGLENILSVCPQPVHTVIGGFHLLDDQLGSHYESYDELIGLAHRLTQQYNNTIFYTSHCTGENAYQTLRKVMGNQLRPFMCGTQIQIS